MNNTDQMIDSLLERFPSTDSAQAFETREQLEIIVHKLKFIPSEQRPVVACVRDLDNFSAYSDPQLEQLIRIAGGIPLEIAGGIPLEAAVNSGPSLLSDAARILILSDEPVQHILSKLPEVLLKYPWNASEAVRNGFIYIVHPPYLRPPGKHLNEEVEILAETIHPGYFVFGREGEAWMRFAAS